MALEAMLRNWNERTEHRIAALRKRITTPMQLSPYQANKNRSEHGTAEATAEPTDPVTNTMRTSRGQASPALPGDQELWNHCPERGTTPMATYYQSRGGSTIAKKQRCFQGEGKGTPEHRLHQLIAAIITNINETPS